MDYSVPIDSHDEYDFTTRRDVLKTGSLICATSTYSQRLSTHLTTTVFAIFLYKHSFLLMTVREPHPLD